MRLLDRILKLGDGSGDFGLKPEEVTNPVNCRHLNLSPKWLDEGEATQGELAYDFDCAACGLTLTGDQAHAVRTAIWTAEVSRLWTER